MSRSNVIGFAFPIAFGVLLLVALGYETGVLR